MDTWWQGYCEKKSKDQRPLEELIATAIGLDDEDAYWDTVGTIQTRTDRATFERAVELCRSGSTPERHVGAGIFSRYGNGEAYRGEVRAELVRMLGEESHCDVLATVCYSLGHLRESAGVPGLSRLSSHPSEDVRMAVVHGLLCQTMPLAVLTLIRMSTDQAADVRNWATFGLAQQIDLDTPEIRSALRARLDDEHCDVRGEALVGLAKRGEPGLVETILRELERDEIYGETFEAAAIIGDRCFVEPLERVQEWWGTENDRCLRYAIEVCSGRANYDDMGSRL